LIVASPGTTRICTPSLSVVSESTTTPSRSVTATTTVAHAAASPR
jgi:hypothetical protein